MATTPKPIPDYYETPSIHALLGKDKNAYLACLFKGATESNVVLTASILIDGKVVLTKTVTGNTGIAMFSVSKIDDNLFLKKVCFKQNIKANLLGLFPTSIDVCYQPFKYKTGHFFLIFNMCRIMILPIKN